MTREKKELLNEAKEFATKIIDTINYIEAGESESTACQKVNIAKSSFRNFVLRKIYNKKNKPEQSPFVVYFGEYDKLFQDVLCYSNHYISKYNVPIDFTETIEYLISKMLTEHEAEIIHLHYLKHMKFSDIAKFKNVSRQAISYFYKRIIDKFRHGAYIGYFLYGKKEFEKMKESQRKENFPSPVPKPFTQTENFRFHKRLLRLMKENNIQDIRELDGKYVSELKISAGIGEKTILELINICQANHISFYNDI